MGCPETKFPSRRNRQGARVKSSQHALRSLKARAQGRSPDDATLGLARSVEEVHSFADQLISGPRQLLGEWR